MDTRGKKGWIFMLIIAVIMFLMIAANEVHTTTLPIVMHERPAIDPTPTFIPWYQVHPWGPTPTSAPLPTDIPSP